MIYGCKSKKKLASLAYFHYFCSKDSCFLLFHTIYMDTLSVIKSPVQKEFDTFVSLFSAALSHPDGLLNEVLSHIRQRGGKRMRPLLTLLMAANYGTVNDATQHAAIGLELLHTASLVHDDVVDESDQRRGQASVNASFDNKVAVLTGDFILSTALLHVAHTHNDHIIRTLAELGRTLSNGELLQLNNFEDDGLNEQAYYDIIRAKTASLFEACAQLGALSVGASQDDVEAARAFGEKVGLIFQIRDDIFDYYDASEIGKPTGNDMMEGKLTLPVLHVLRQHPDNEMLAIAKKVKEGTVNSQEVSTLVRYTKEKGGIEYAEKVMKEMHNEACRFIEIHVKRSDISTSLTTFLDFIIQRKK